jgi:lysophospholipase L1-like esterase
MVDTGRRRTLSYALACVLIGIGMCACSGSPKTSASQAKATQYYVSLGDSYAAGFQPTGPDGVGRTTTNGFAYQVLGLASAHGYHLRLVNFGCEGATTTSLFRNPGCSLLGPGAPHYPSQSQAAAVESFLHQHQGNIGLVTVSIGGNDVTECASSSDPIGCVVKAVTTISTNLSILLPALRTASGPEVPIVGITYPDVALGDYLSSKAADRALATLSVAAFKDVINPALQKQYEAVGATFVDVTSATGAYTPFDQTTSLAPYGIIPVAVAQICQLTYFCEYGDIHPRTVGYTKIAELISAALPVR